jgi:hypothetical protein
VSVDLQEPLGVEPARIALDEFRATQDEYSEFFGDVFDQLQALSLELFARHKCLEAGTQPKPESEESFVGLRQEFHHWIEELQQLHGQFQADQQETQKGWAEIRAGCQPFLDEHADLRQICKHFRQITGDLYGIKKELKRIRNLLETENPSENPDLTPDCTGLNPVLG